MSTVFGERLTNARKSMGWTRKRAVSEFNLPYQTYSNYEQGKREPDIDTIKAFALKLHVTTDYLTGANDNPHNEANSVETDLDKLIDNAHSYDGKPITGRDRDVIKAFLKGLYTNN